MDITVVLCPVYQNPYQHLLTDALRRVGVEVHHHGGMPSARWLVEERERVQVLHMHWLYGLYMNRYLTPVTWAAFVARFALARRLGYSIVWTAHNIVPHRMPFPPMHLAVRRLVMRQADAVIAHCEYARQELLRRFPLCEQVSVVSIGTYSGVYPVDVTTREARIELGLDPLQFVYLFLGNIAPYKGLPALIQAFQNQAKGGDTLVIAGRNRDADLVCSLEAAAEADSRVIVHAGFIPGDQIQKYLCAANVMVTPFRKILTSSSVMVGMSYRLPIIAPTLGCLPELVSPDAGILYDPDDPEALGQALRRIKEMDTHAMGIRAKAIADALRWDDIAQETAAIYRECVEG